MPFMEPVTPLLQNPYPLPAPRTQVSAALDTGHAGLLQQLEPFGVLQGTLTGDIVAAANYLQQLSNTLAGAWQTHTGIGLHDLAGALQQIVEGATPLAPPADRTWNIPDGSPLAGWQAWVQNYLDWHSGQVAYYMNQWYQPPQG